MRTYRALRGAAVIAILVVVALVPPLFGTYVTSAIGLKSLWLGLCAASLTFLATYGGMVSLAQVGLFGVAGLVTASLSAQRGLDPWLSALVGIGATTLVGLLFGALASGSTGVYFLMITLALGMISYLLFSAVPEFGFHEGINGVFPPDVLGDPVLEPTTIYYFILGVCIVVYVGLRYLVRTPFGIALQGVRDEPVRMASMGYSPRLYRTLAFALAAAIAGAAGIFSAWTNTRISAGSINLGVTIGVLTAAVIGGLWRLEGAWVGALVLTALATYGPGLTARDDTVIGLIFLVIVLVSPGGLLGIVARADDQIVRWLRGRGRSAPLEAGPGATPGTG
jgi:branched-chain amino acid transport system permease protein